jgi:hypothetical protein
VAPPFACAQSRRRSHQRHPETAPRGTEHRDSSARSPGWPPVYRHSQPIHRRFITARHSMLRSVGQAGGAQGEMFGENRHNALARMKLSLRLSPLRIGQLLDGTQLPDQAGTLPPRRRDTSLSGVSAEVEREYRWTRRTTSSGLRERIVPEPLRHFSRNALRNGPVTLSI